MRIDGFAGQRQVVAWRRAAAGIARPEAIVFLLAVLARQLPAFQPGGGGLRGIYGYDASVYYAAADGLVHGRVPYRDFVLVHPPGLILIDAPFAWFGSMTTDMKGFILANTAFTLLSGVNAVLVVRCARLMGVSHRASVFGGLLYALWFGAVGSEFLARLEPLGNFAVLCGLLGLLAWRQADARRPAEPARARWLPIVAGLAFGFAASVKIWWTVPLLAVLFWVGVVDRRPAAAARMVLGAMATFAVIDLPFLILARSAMWSMVVTDQLGRPRNNTSPAQVLGYLISGRFGAELSHRSLRIMVAAALVVFAAACCRAWRIPAARLPVALVLVQLVQILAEPSWFPFYSDFLTVTGALVLAASCTRSPGRPAATTTRARSWVPVALAAVLVGAFLVSDLDTPHITPFPTDRFRSAAARLRCVMSDSPMALIEVDALSRSFAPRCRDWVDVTGRLYGPDAPVGPRGGRDDYRRWNRDLTSYLLSGNGFILIRRPRNLALGHHAVTQLDRAPILLRAGGYVLRGRIPSS